MPQQIILIRHGETQDNLEHRLQGWRDTPLNETGRNQARILAAAFPTYHPAPIAAIYSSDLSRAYETALPLSRRLSLPLVKDQRLREHHLGKIAGLRFGKAEQKKNLLWEEFLHAQERLDMNWNAHHGETMKQFLTRLKDFLSFLSSQHSRQTVVCVTHGGTINRILELIARKKAHEYFSLPNTSLTILIKKGQKYQADPVGYLLNPDTL